MLIMYNKYMKYCARVCAARWSHPV